MNKSSHAKQFLLPDYEYYCNAAPIPFVGLASIPQSHPQRPSSAQQSGTNAPVPARSNQPNIPRDDRSGSDH